MRRNYLESGILLFGCLIFLASCKKDVGSAPTIHFLSPVHAEHLDLDYAVSVDIDIRDNQEIDSYFIELKSETGFEYFREEKSVHKEYHRISYEFDLSSAKEHNFEIRVLVKDNDGNQTNSQITVNTDK